MVSAIIVLFNPDLNHLCAFIDSILNQVESVILVDNTPTSIKKYDVSLFVKDRVVYLDLGDNLGIAKAHNVGINKSIELGVDYFIIFDQDSSIEENLVSSLVSLYEILIDNGEKVAAIGPAYLDIKTDILAPAIQFNGLKVNRVPIDKNSLYTKADYIISSGTLISVEAIKEIGEMQEDLFIDYVDVEWGLRAKQKGYQCFIANQVLMRHSIGDSSIKVPFSKKFVNIHSDFRKYFILRNAMYLIIYSKLPLNWRIVQVPKTIMYIGFLFLFVPPRLNNIKIFMLALKDATIKRMYKGSM